MKLHHREWVRFISKKVAIHYRVSSHACTTEMCTAVAMVVVMTFPVWTVTSCMAVGWLFFDRCHGFHGLVMSMFLVLKDWTCINSPNMNHSSSVVVLNCQHCRVTISCHYCCNITADGVLSKQSNITFWKSEPFSSSRVNNCTTEWCVVLRRLYGNTLQNCRYSVYHEASLTLRICDVKNLTLKLWTCLTPFLNDLSSCHVFLEKKL